MTPDHYRVFNSAFVAEQYRRLAEEARSSGRLHLFLRATRWVMEELARTPFEFGESREARPDNALAMRCGFARPLYVEYAVREDERVVYIRKMTLVRDS